MSVTLTYETALSRVKIVATGMGTATTGIVERSLNQITWTTVRGGQDAPIVSGSLTVYDYEFASDVVNYYRVTTPKDVSFVSKGTVAHGDNASLNPGLPAGGAAGDTLILTSAILGLAAFPQTPAGYTLIGNASNFRVFAKAHVGGGEIAPTVTFSGGVAGDTTSAQLACFRNLSGPSLADPLALSLRTPAAQNIAYAGLAVSPVHALILYTGWKADDWISTTTLAGDGGVAAKIDDPSTTTGNDQGLVWDYCVQTTKVNVAAGSFLVSGGGAALSSSMIMDFKPADLVQTASTTPAIQGVWLKSIRFPFLNRQLFCLTNVSPIARKSRTALFDVIGRSYPVAITDLRRSRELSVDVVTQTAVEWQDLDFALSTGDEMFLQAPASYPYPSLYVVVGDVLMARPLFDRSCGKDWRVFTLPLTEVAAPGPDVVGATVTWQGVLNAFATWQAVVTAKATWLDLLQSVGTPADVIVP
jgi:hypothetical protein